MGESYIDLVRDGFEALRDGDVEALLPLIHPEFEVTTPPGLARRDRATDRPERRWETDTQGSAQAPEVSFWWFGDATAYPNHETLRGGGIRARPG